MEKEYVVSLNKDVDYDSFWQEIENLSEKDNFVPERRVEIVNNRNGSLRSCHYALTEEEANILRHDPRVYSVEIPPDQRDDIQIVKFATQTANFDKPTGSSGTNTNWGLKRNIARTNIYGTSTTSPSSNYDYILDGTGVDIVIQDSGIEHAHPEFKDISGDSRVQLIDWYTESGLSGTQSANHYRDYDGHGTHVAGIAAGLTYGWAKNARIYSVKISGLEGSGDSGTGIAISDCFDIIKLWHRNKSVDPKTGIKRPTLVNMSWGYSTTYANSDVNTIRYRGTTYTLPTSNDRWSAGLLPLTANGDVTYISNVRVGSVDTDVEELIDEGVHVFIAAGNNYHKIDLPGGVDYDNYYIRNSTSATVYYHRGSSPRSTKAVNVGNINSTAHDASTDKKADTSETGPGVDIYAAGTNIISACSNTNIHTGVTYHLNSGFKQVNLGGTSMASPQVCGQAALVLQMNPGLTPYNLKEYLVKNSVKNVIYDTGLDDDWSTSFTSLKGGNNRMLYSPISIAENRNTQGSLILENIAISLT